jgi:hypothetical protein
MTTAQPSDLKFQAYLLGELEDAEFESLEAFLREDTQSLARLEEAETRLIESYLAGTLDRRRGDSFRAAYLGIPARRQRLEEVRSRLRASAAAGEVDADEAGQLRWLTLAILGGALAAAGSAIWVWLRVPESPGTTVRTVMVNPGAAEPRPAEAVIPEPKRYSAYLRPGRGGTFDTPASGEMTLTFRLPANPHAAFRLQVQADGRTVFRQAGLLTRSSHLKVTLPADQLSPGDYAAAVEGISAGQEAASVANYTFRLRKVAER